MKISIRVSKGMTGPEAPLGRLERYLIRIPEKVRDKFGLGIGDPLRLKTTDGIELLVTVQPALKQDIFYDDTCSYVTKEVFKRVNVGSKRKIDEKVKLLKGITLGCDPEFFMVDTKNKYFVSAGAIFGGKRTKLGTDCGMVEIRPDPAKHEDGVVDNMRKLIIQADHRLAKAMNTRPYYRDKDLGFLGKSALGIRYAGFHLHFGLHPRLKKRTPAVKEFLRQVVYIMDYYVAIPSIIPEGVKENGRRSGPGRYGMPGDFKTNNGITLEYRVPGGYHMRSPMLAKGLIGLGALVAEDVLSRTKLLTDGFRQLSKFSTYNHVREVYPRIPDRRSVITAIRAKEPVLARRCLDNIADDLAEMLTFKDHEKSVAKFIEYAASDKHAVRELMSDNWS